MDILNALMVFANSPATGDNFPVVPIIAVGGIAVVIAVASSIAAAAGKKKDKNDKK